MRRGHRLIALISHPSSVIEDQVNRLTNAYNQEVCRRELARAVRGLRPRRKLVNHHVQRPALQHRRGKPAPLRRLPRPSRARVYPLLTTLRAGLQYHVEGRFGGAPDAAEPAGANHFAQFRLAGLSAQRGTDLLR